MKFEIILKNSVLSFNNIINLMEETKISNKTLYSYDSFQHSYKLIPIKILVNQIIDCALAFTYLTSIAATLSHQNKSARYLH
jgi:hypothetical protein